MSTKVGRKMFRETTVELELEGVTLCECPGK